MVKTNHSLAERFSATLSKISGLSELSSTSSPISGVFKIAPLTVSEKEKVSEILDTHRKGENETTYDFHLLSDLTAEIKAITCQAAILHGERIKKAQNILKKYRDGAFTAWLIAAYGNRQTPYNFLQYYELYRAIPAGLSKKLDEIPRQIAYTLASRTGSLAQKIDLIRRYNGQSKEEMLRAIRSAFPLSLQDKRAHDPARQLIENLRRIERQMTGSVFSSSEEQKKELKLILTAMKKYLV